MRASAVEAPPATRLTFKAPRGKGTRDVACGFAWDLFLFAPLFGLPLFWRRLPQWGAGVLALWLVALLAGWVIPGGGAGIVPSVLAAVFFVVELWLGVKGNELTARAYLAQGWTIDHPEFVANRRLIEHWGLEG